ncbi:Uncharacterised protein [Mycobacterium tuberculosis]|nr:Uncharacterised protein [Mycobacterium tuberculosis]
MHNASQMLIHCRVEIRNFAHAKQQYLGTMINRVDQRGTKHLRDSKEERAFHGANAKLRTIVQL